MQQALYRQTFDSTALMRDYPPKFRNSHKAALFNIAYPDGDLPHGKIEVTRWKQIALESVALSHSPRVEVRPNFYDYLPVDEAKSTLQWHVNFADPDLFYAYGDGLFAQDEMQVAEHPMLGCIREALLAKRLAAKTVEGADATPVLVRNVQRRIEIMTHPDPLAGRPLGLYGNRFSMAPFDAVRRATRRIVPPTYSNIAAMAAPSGGDGAYSDSEIAYTFSTAVTAFTAARYETIVAHGDDCLTVVHTGFWGCGAFGGNRKLMIALQALAARTANISRLVLHAGDAAGAIDAAAGLNLADGFVARCGASCSFESMIEFWASLGLRWGVSDGN